MATIYLVSCVARKKGHAVRAKELYESPWFKKARAYVEARGGRWFILSAQYGLLDPESIVDPYEKTLNQMGVRERREWARQVLGHLREAIKPDDHVVVLAGGNYRELLLDGLRAMCRQVDAPMRGMRIGEQLSWLGREAAAHGQA